MRRLKLASRYGVESEHSNIGSDPEPGDGL